MANKSLSVHKQMVWISYSLVNIHHFMQPSNWVSHYHRQRN